jgi:dipeptidyl-peptidase 4
MGHPVDASYGAASNATHAHRLCEGAGLLLVVGELDSNVDPASTMRLAHALIEARKDFELVVIPGADHDVMTLPHVMRKQEHFFKRYLQGY